MVLTEVDPVIKAAEEKVYDKILSEEIKQWVQRQVYYKAGMSKAYGLIMKSYMGIALKARVEAEADFESVIKDNVIELLKRIRELTHETDESRYPYMAVIETIARMINLRQQDDEDLITYVRRFKNQRDIVKEQLGNKFLESFVEWTQEYKDLGGDVTRETALKKTAMEKFYGALLIRNSDRVKYGPLLTMLTSQYSMTQDQYPKTLVEATKVLELHRFDPSYYERKKKSKEKKANMTNQDTNNSSDGPAESSFSQAKSEKANTSKAIICYCCGSKSHKAPQCSERGKITRDEWWDRKIIHASHLQEEEEVQGR
jgi:hypothetical protein